MILMNRIFLQKVTSEIFRDFSLCSQYSGYMAILESLIHILLDLGIHLTTAATVEVRTRLAVVM